MLLASAPQSCQVLSHFPKQASLNMVVVPRSTCSFHFVVDDMWLSLLANGAAKKYPSSQQKALSLPDAAKLTLTSCVCSAAASIPGPRWSPAAPNTPLIDGHTFSAQWPMRLRYVRARRHCHCDELGQCLKWWRDSHMNWTLLQNVLHTENKIKMLTKTIQHSLLKCNRLDCSRTCHVGASDSVVKNNWNLQH